MLHTTVYYKKKYFDISGIYSRNEWISNDWSFSHNFYLHANESLFQTLFQGYHNMSFTKIWNMYSALYFGRKGETGHNHGLNSIAFSQIVQFITDNKRHYARTQVVQLIPFCEFHAPYYWDQGFYVGAEVSHCLTGLIRLWWRTNWFSLSSLNTCLSKTYVYIIYIYI